MLLKDIIPDSIQATIRVQAVGFCEHLNIDTPPQPLWIHLVLPDQVVDIAQTTGCTCYTFCCLINNYVNLLIRQGKAMAGQVPQRWISLFKEQLNEDYVYYIKYLRICNARPTYRPVDHPYMMPFTAHTRVHEVMLVPDTFTNSNVRLQTSWVDVLRTWLHKAEYTSGNMPYKHQSYLATVYSCFHMPFCIVLTPIILILLCRYSWNSGRLLTH